MRILLHSAYIVSSYTSTDDDIMCTFINPLGEILSPSTTTTTRAATAIYGATERGTLSIPGALPTGTYSASWVGFKPTLIIGPAP